MEYNYQKMFWAKYRECERLKKLLEEYGYESDDDDKVINLVKLKTNPVNPAERPIQSEERLIQSEERPSSNPHNTGSWSRGISVNKQNQSSSHPFTTNQSEIPNRCKASKLNNHKQCRQRNNPNQTGGEIIDGYCEYHKHLRKNI